MFNILYTHILIFKRYQLLYLSCHFALNTKYMGVCIDVINFTNYTTNVTFMGRSQWPSVQNLCVSINLENCGTFP